MVEQGMFAGGGKVKKPVRYDLCQRILKIEDAQKERIFSS
jgi:hypothetical protein